MGHPERCAISLFSHIKQKPAVPQKTPPFHCSGSSFPYCLFSVLWQQVAAALSLVASYLNTASHGSSLQMGMRCRHESNQNRAGFFACSSTSLSPVCLNHHCCCNANRSLCWLWTRPVAEKSWQIYVNLKCYFYNQTYWALEDRHIKLWWAVNNPGIFLTTGAKPSETALYFIYFGFASNVLRDKQGLNIISCPGLSCLECYLMGSEAGRDLEWTGVECGGLHPLGRSTCHGWEGPGLWLDLASN